MILLIIFGLLVLDLILKYKKSNTNLFSIIVIILIIYAGLRSMNYTTDINNYRINFNEINSLKDVISSNYEKGYTLFIYASKLIGFGFHTCMFIVAYLSVNMKTTIMKKYSPLPTVSLLLYFMLFYIYNDVEQIRHGISVAFCLYSMQYLLKNDRKSIFLSIAFWCLAISFHSSAFLFLPMILIRSRLISKKNLIISFVVAFLFSSINWFSLITTVNDLLIKSSYIKAKVELYSVSTSSSFISITLLVRIFMLLTFYYYAYECRDKLHRLLLNTYILGLFYTIALRMLPIVSARGTTYMRYAEIIMIPIIICSTKNSNKFKYLTVAMIFIYYFSKFIVYISSQNYFIYSSI